MRFTVEVVCESLFEIGCKADIELLVFHAEKNVNAIQEFTHWIFCPCFYEFKETCWHRAVESRVA